MKTCLRCKHADWRKTKNGRFHPSGDGNCLILYKVKPLPNSMYWFGEPNPCGGHIERKRVYDKNCPYYQEDL